MRLIEDTRFLARMRIPSLYWGCTFEAIPSYCDHLEIVQSFAHDIERHVDEGRGLMLWGDYSTGKSAVAALLLRSLPTGRWGLFVMAEHVAGYVIEKTRFDEDETYEERMGTADLLVIDEVVLHDTDTFRDHVIETVFRNRVREQKSTIVTTNLSPEEFQKQYPALGEVMVEAVVPVNVRGFNFRKGKAAKLLREVTPK